MHWATFRCSPRKRQNIARINKIIPTEKPAIRSSVHLDLWSNSPEKIYRYLATVHTNYSHRGWSPKFETGINIIIKSALYSIFWQDSITNIKINSFQIFWRLCDPFYWEYTKDLLGVYFGYTGGIFGLYLSYSGAILELYWGYLILGV